MWNVTVEKLLNLFIKGRNNLLYKYLESVCISYYVASR